MPPPVYGPHPAAAFLRKHGSSVAEKSEAEQIAEAFDQWPVPDDYHLWIKGGFVLKSTLPDEDGRQLWHRFSARSTKYNYAEAEKKWNSFRPRGEITALSAYWGARR